VSGAIALELAVKRRHEISGLAAVMLLYSIPFAWGFLTSHFGGSLFGNSCVVGRSLCGVGATAFSVGFGPELFGYADGLGTRWQLFTAELVRT
jgi:hypothetical protein